MTIDNVLKIVTEAKEVDVEDARQPKAGATKPQPQWSPVVVRVSDEPPREIVWLWPRRIARGKLTIIAGHPGVSKSTLLIDMTARVTRGEAWPCNEGRAPSGSVVLLTSEDDVGDTIRPRLAAAGADVGRVHVLKGAKSPAGERRGFDLTSDVAILEHVLEKVGDVAMVVIDPVTAYMGRPGKIDSHRVTDVRATFEPLQDLAARRGIAIVGVNHLTKSGNNEALMRFLGSVGMVAVGRAAYLVARDKDDPGRRLFLPAKNNLGDDATGFAFKVVEKPTGYDAPAKAVAIEWEGERVTDITADEALAPEQREDGRKSEGLEVAKKIVGDMLAKGPRPAGEVEKAVSAAGIGGKSLRNAKRALGVASSKNGKAGWDWYLSERSQDEMPF